MQGIRPLLQFIAVMMLSGFSATAEVISLGVYQDHLDNINDYVEANGCPAMPDASLGENQILAEYLILCNALKSSKVPFEIQLSPYPVNQRAIDRLEAGEINGTAMGVWSFDVASSKNIQLSEPLLREGEFVKGLYTTKDKAQEFALGNEIQYGVALLNQNWDYDWKSLECFGLQLRHVSRYQQMFGMLARERGDFIPLTFGQGANMKRHQFGIDLYPIHGYKIAFPFSLNFAVNTSLAKGKRLLNELNKGIVELRKTQHIHHAYRQLGLINSVYSQWQNIGCSQG